MKPINVFCLLALVIVLSLSFGCIQNVQQSKSDAIAKSDAITNEGNFVLLGFVLFSDTLEDVRSRLGKAEILVGKRHEPSQVCYVSSEPNDDTTVLFQAGFMGGRKTLTSFILANKKVVAQQCLPSPLVSKDISTPSGIKLGLRTSQLKNLLGEPTKVDGNVLIYYLITQSKMTENEIARAAQIFGEERDMRYPYWDVSHYIEAKIADGQVGQLRITRIETR